MKVLLFSLILCPLSIALKGKHLKDGDVNAYLGIRYAQQLTNRLQNSKLIGTFDESADYSQWKSRCITEHLEEGTSEDCLFLSILIHRDVEKATPVLLYITNEELSETKLGNIVTKELTVVIANARQGAFASFDQHSFATSDIENVFKFLANERERFHIGDITVMADEYLAETVSLIIDKIDAKRAILNGGNALTRSTGREKFSQKAASRLLGKARCDLPSEAQAMDCLRALDTKEFMEHVKAVKESFYPFADPFRVPVNRKIVNNQIPTLYVTYKAEAPERYGYPTTSNFTESYTHTAFKQFMAGLIPDSLHSNAPLLRRLALHHYVHTKGDKKDIYFLFETMRKMLFDRDFVAPTHKLVMHLAKAKKNIVWLLEYAIDNPPKNCLQDSGWDDIEPFCKRLVGYYARVASKGSPTDAGCSAENPTFPAMGRAKREFFIKLHADGRPDWDFNFHLADVVLWNELLPAMDKIELAGRRDSIFPEEQEKNPLDEEDDLQAWHFEEAKTGKELHDKRNKEKKVEKKEEL